MPSHIVVKKERTVRVDAELWHTSECLLLAGQECELGSAHQFRASLIFTAFAFEAYLNHIGPSLFTTWSDIERKLTPQGKLSLLCECLAITTDWSSRPWQSIKALFRFRNTLAHGRGEQLQEDVKRSVQHYQREIYVFPLTEWEKFASAETALRAREDVLQVTELLQEKSNRHDNIPFLHGAQGVSATHVPNG